jgi:hypothetical protein
MVERTTVSQPNRPPGILEHVSDGMSDVLAYPQLVLIPVLLDLYLLFGARISAGSLTSRLGDWFAGRSGQNALDAGKWVRDLGDWDVSRLLALLMPSVLDGMGQDTYYRPFDRLAWSPSSLGVVAASIGMILIGSVIFTIYITMLASRTRMIRANSLPPMRLLLDRWVKMLGLFGLLIGVIASLSAVMIVPAAILAAGGVSATTMAGLAWLVGSIALVVTMFAPEAIVIDGASPIAAVRASAQVVFRFFWQSAAFFAVSLMISPGLLSIWERIAGDPVGLGIAIVLNAAMVTSLSLASLAFYRARFDGVAPLQQTI